MQNALPVHIEITKSQHDKFAGVGNLVLDARCKLRCKFCSRLSPEEQRSDQTTEGTKNKQDGEYQSYS